MRIEPRRASSDYRGCCPKAHPPAVPLHIFGLAPMAAWLLALPFRSPFGSPKRGPKSPGRYRLSQAELVLVGLGTCSASPPLAAAAAAWLGGMMRGAGSLAP